MGFLNISMLYSDAGPQIICGILTAWSKMLCRFQNNLRFSPGHHWKRSYNGGVRLPKMDFLEEATEGRNALYSAL